MAASAARLAPLLGLEEDRSGEMLDFLAISKEVLGQYVKK